jgi:hypothetical protein
METDYWMNFAVTDSETRMVSANENGRLATAVLCELSNDFGGAARI